MFFFKDTATTEIYTRSLHDALPISMTIVIVAVVIVVAVVVVMVVLMIVIKAKAAKARSEEHTSELQSHSDIVCRLLLVKKKCQQTSFIIRSSL